MTDRQMESLRYTLWAELQLPEAPEFIETVGGAGRQVKLTSQEYTTTGGFMAKFVESYNLTLVIHPDQEEAGLFDAGCTVTVNYQHGKWERAGSNGVGTTLFHSVKDQHWVDADTARQMYVSEQERAAR